jgi:hypothetical protein
MRRLNRRLVAEMGKADFTQKSALEKLIAPSIT